jgi:hypothetical protein
MWFGRRDMSRRGKRRHVAAVQNEALGRNFELWHSRSSSAVKTHVHSSMPGKGPFVIPKFIAFVALVGLAGSVWGATSSNLTWTTFEDPTEHAFTLEVPKGWTVRGGLFRLGYSDARAMVDIQSPDGQTEVRIGDAAIPAYFVPNQFHSTEGEIYDLGAQAQMIVAKYRPGSDYAKLYALGRFSGVCKSLTPQSIDSASPVHDYLPQQIAPAQSSAGQIEYRCDSGQRERIAYAYTRTSLFGGFWQVAALGSFLAPRDQTDLTRGILARATQSFKVLPAWKQHQQQMDAQGLEYQRARQQQRRTELSQQVQEFETRMRGMRSQMDAFERRQSAQAAQVTSWGNTLTGITPTTDPLNGTTRDVWTGPKSGYWMNSSGQVMNSNISPGAGWRPLQPQ